MYSIKIDQQEKGVLTASLRDILTEVKDGEKLSWRILWLIGVGKLEGTTMLAFENKVKESVNGWPFEWEELLSFSKAVDQIIEVLIIGDSENSSLKRYEDDKTMRENCAYVFELIDSSYWLISSKDEEFLKRVKSKFA